jgi:hypothetical protein
VPDEEEDYGDEVNDMIEDLDAADGVGAINHHKAPVNEEMPKDDQHLGKHQGKPLSGLKK